MPPLEYHPLANIFPLMDDAELGELADDIEANGLHDLIWLYEGKILDGRNRYRACLARDIDPRFAEYKGRDALGFVISKNLKRRHLSTSQRAMVAAAISTARRGNQPAPNGVNLPHLTAPAAAAALNVSPESVKDAKGVLAHGVPELVEAVKAGDVTVSAAAEVAKLPEDEQRETVAAGPAAVKDKAAEARQERKEQAGGGTGGGIPPTGGPGAAPAGRATPVETRPPPHQTRTRKGKPAAAGVGGEVSRLPAVEQQYGRLVREVEEFAKNRAEQNGKSHREALDLLDGFLSHMKRWDGRARKAKTA